MRILKITIVTLMLLSSLIVPRPAYTFTDDQLNTPAADADVIDLSLGGTSGSIPGAPAGECVLGETQYSVEVSGQEPCSTTFIEFHLSATPGVNLYVRFGQKVTMEDGNIAADYRSETATENKRITLVPPYEEGKYYIAMSNCGAEAATFSLILGVAAIHYFGPIIRGASMSGKKMFVSGCNFDDGAVLLINEVEQPIEYKVRRGMPTLVAKKAGKKIAPGESVVVHIRDSNGRLSPPFTFSRSEE